jgi:flagellar protein FlbD
MITLHSANGTAFAINSDLVEKVEESADTHVTLIGGTSYVVEEGLDAIVALVQHDRAIVRALADRYLLAGGLPDNPGLHVQDRENGPLLRVFYPLPDETGEGGQ